MENRKNAIKIFGKFVAFWLWNCSERLKKVLQCYSVYDSIIAESGILKFSQNNNSRIISVDAGYSVLCYKENQ